jgi:hypothetical protein
VGYAWARSGRLQQSHAEPDTHQDPSSESGEHLATQPALSHGLSIDVYAAAAALTGLGLGQAGAELDALFAIHLIEEPARGRYRFHELLGDYARALAATDPPGHQDIAIGRGGSGTGAVSAGSGAVSSPRPSNRACGSPAHGLPTFFTVGVRPARARTGRAWAG